jgi:hypothetical protein
MLIWKVQQGCLERKAGLFGTYSRPVWNVQQACLERTAGMFGTYSRPVWNVQQACLERTTGLILSLTASGSMLFSADSKKL